MTDHAKALAEALRDIVEFYDIGEVAVPPDSLHGVALAALAAYDAAQSAEAATRENGDIVDRLRDEIRDWKCGSVVEEALAEIVRLRALSTHQQQGVESELVERLREGAETLTALNNAHGENQKVINLLTDAADALSRAPQPDTVTEEMIGAAARAISGVHRSWDGDIPHDFVAHTFSEAKTLARAALTAASR